MADATWNRQIETVEALPAFSEIPGSTCAYGEMDFGDELVMIGIVPPEYTDVSCAANVHALAESKIQTDVEWLAVLSKTGIN
jgi:hypothetical protein